MIRRLVEGYFFVIGLGAYCRRVQPRRRSRPWLPLWGSWRAISEPERAFAVANMGKVRRLQPGPSQLRQPPAIEPGDPQRCGLTARVAGSSLPAGSTRPLSHGLRRASAPKGRAKGRASPAQSRPAQSAEPGDPQRCGLTARVAGSSLPAGSTRPLSHGFQP